MRFRNQQKCKCSAEQFQNPKHNIFKGKLHRKGNTMSRMATMQVLNQSFRNLNDALNSYMRNRNDSDKLNRQFENQKSLAELNNAAKAQEGKLSRENQLKLAELNNAAAADRARLALENRLNIANANLDYRKLQAELAQKQAAEKAKAAAAQADERAVYQYLTDNPDKTVMEAVAKLREMKSTLNGQVKPNGGQSAMTPKQALQAYKDGKITKEQLANIRKNF